MKPDWEKLANSFGDSKTQLIADVDCTTEGEPLCGQFGVQGFPTIKWGDPADLQDYEGGRDYDSLKAFADENLKPQCSPANLDLCDDDKKVEIKKYMDMDAKDLKAAIEEKEATLAKIDEDFEAFIEGLQKSYEDMMEKNQEEKDAIKDSGLGLMKAVRASLAVESGNDEL
jgi:hypothetical protein